LGGTETFEGTVGLFAPTQGQIELAVLSFDPLLQELEVELPPEIDSLPGTFLLAVSAGLESSSSTPQREPG